MKKILIAGGSGFLGKALTQYFVDKNYTVKILTRNPKKENHIYWDAKTLGNWITELTSTDILINLTGKSVDCRYTEKNKKEIIDSRIFSTKILEQAINECESEPSLWINASSATIYAHAEQQLMTESTGLIGDDFSMNVCKTWERVFLQNEIDGLRKVATRISIVLGNEGGGFPKMKMITKLGLGGHQGNGNQKMSWIHINDYCRAVDHIINTTYLEGAVNITTPTPVSNKTFMSKLRKNLGMPFGMPQPKFLLELGAFLLGTETELLLKSRNVYPERLLKSDFQFTYNTLDEALYELSDDF